ncbi:MAG TPA: nucleotidyltransferase family protein [Candidatus Acidoferrum sp.]|nr:nucleotidyltransferase family protein [Candidatus Acidoferrum sp.]
MNDALPKSGHFPVLLQQELCYKLLRDEPTTWRYGEDAATVTSFIDFLQFHGIECLVLERLDLLADCPASLRARLAPLVRARAAIELRSRQAMDAVLAALAAANIEVLTYKGAALAYSLYRNPVWRTRSDTDMLIGEDKLETAIALLLQLGYRRTTTDDEIVFYQLDFGKPDAAGAGQNIDLHWKLSNSEVLCDLLPFGELWSRRQQVPALSVHANTVAAADALLIACLHRGIHQQASYTVNDITHHTGDRLIWLYDIDQLARAFGVQQWLDFFALARGKGLVATCRQGLLKAQQAFATPLPDTWAAELAGAAIAMPDRYLQGGAIKRHWYDLQACKGIRNKARHCVQVLLPPAEYMRHKYADSRVRWLPWLYLRRAVSGLLMRWRQGDDSA